MGFKTRGSRKTLAGLFPRLAVAAAGAICQCSLTQAALEEPGRYPLQYQAHKLRADESIILNGQLEEAAWAAVPWTETFQDIEGPIKNAPRFQTKVKMRWDSTCLYVGAYLEEPQAWANLTERNSIIFHDNDFEVFCDPDGSTHFYKEFEVNALSTTWNLMLISPYLNGGPAVCNYTVPGQCSSSDPSHGVPSFDMGSDLKAATHVDGHLNDPAQGSRSWTVEACLPLADYAKYEDVNMPPKEGDYWRINFSRVQWRVTVHTNDDGSQVYWKDEESKEDNWVWQPLGVVNMHLPERWGYLRFTEHGPGEGPADPGPHDPLWPVRWALSAVYNAQKAFSALYGTGYAASLDSLATNARLPVEVVQGRFAGVPNMNATAETFEVAVASRDVVGAVGHIQDDRRIWFTYGPHPSLLSSDDRT